MRRYGDNVSADEAIEAGPVDRKFEYTRVFYGGCGFGAGPFVKPAQVQKPPRTGLLSFLKFGRRKPVEEKT